MLSGAATLSIQNKREWTRRAVHLAFGSCALLVPLLGRGGSIGLAATALAYNALLAPRLGLDSGYRRPGERRVSGLVTYPLAVLLLLCIAPLPVAGAAWVIMAVADPIAAAVGSQVPRPRVPYHPRKSLIGSAAGLIAAALACAGYLHFVGAKDPLVPALVAAVAGVLAESIPWPFDDNLPIALFSATTLWAWGI